MTYDHRFRVWASIIATIFVLTGTTPACTLKPKDDPEPALSDRLGDHLQRAIETEASASHLWDRILFGEPVSCQEALTVPLRFEITPAEQQSEPLSVPVAEHLNNAIAALETAVAIWDEECTQSRDVIPLAVVQQAQMALKQARKSLGLATDAWTVWQS
ncbi:MAG: hypothetical protein GYB66_04525 [Chloroflexi bacterium]|nr:hypothetical protein [Chloroflexota bacterium]